MCLLDRASYKELKALQDRYPKNVSEQIEILNTRDSILQEGNFIAKKILVSLQGWPPVKFGTKEKD